MNICGLHEAENDSENVIKHLTCRTRLFFVQIPSSVIKGNSAE